MSHFTRQTYCRPLKACTPADITYEELVLPSVQSVTAILHAAAHESNVKRVVITSSSAAAGLHQADGPIQRWDMSSWNEDKSLIERETAVIQLYIESKVRSERAAWHYMEAHKARRITQKKESFANESYCCLAPLYAQCCHAQFQFWAHVSRIQSE